MPQKTFYHLPKQKQSELLTIAAQEFAAHSFTEATISKIVLQDGISNDNFYQYFEDKQDLFKT